jgi:hypothetical protein
VVRHIQQELGVPCTEVKAYFQMYGGFNGGTLASGFNLYESGQVAQVGNPFLLNPWANTLEQRYVIEILSTPNTMPTLVHGLGRSS